MLFGTSQIHTDAREEKKTRCQLQQRGEESQTEFVLVTE